MEAELIGLVFVTSALSGVLGMAGGMIGMAAMVWALPVADAMVLHGWAQGIANGSRAWALRDAARWRLLAPYALGAVGAMLAAKLAFALGVPLPATWAVQVAVGAVALLGPYAPLPGDITRPRVAALAGASVSSVQLLAGVGGPLLDRFFLQSGLDRRSVVGTKAATQVIAHAVKLAVFGGLGGWPSAATAVGVALAALAGTYLGTALLARWGEEGFQRWTRRVMVVVGLACVGWGVARATG